MLRAANLRQHDRATSLRELQEWMRPGALELPNRELLRIIEVIGRIDLSRPCVATRSERTSCQVTVSRSYRFSLALELVDSHANWR